MDIKNLSDAYDNCSFFMCGINKTSGKVQIIQTGFAQCVYFREDTATTDPPHLNNKFFMSVLTQPYISTNGHIYFDLSFYNTFTIITGNDQLKFSFHDVTQDPGISIIFQSKDQFSHFYDSFIMNFSISEQELPGSFKIMRKMKPIIKQIEKYKPDMSMRTSQAGYAEFQLIENHNKTVLENLKEKAEVDNENIKYNEAYQDIEKLSKFVLQNGIPSSQRAVIWCKLACIGDLPEINPVIREYYQRIKTQWTSLKQSQLSRCKLFVSNKNAVEKDIKLKQQLFFTIIPDRQILKLAFNVLMTICQTFNELNEYRFEIIYIIRVFVAMFTRQMIKGENDKCLYVINDKITMDQESLEAAIYWSVILILEKGDVRNCLTGQEYFQNTSMVFNQIINKFSPLTLDLIRSKGQPRFDQLHAINCTAFSRFLPLCDCAEVWVYALASGNMSSFFVYLSAIAFLYYVPLIIHVPKPVDTGEIAIQAFQLENIDYKVMSKVALQAIKENVL